LKVFLTGATGLLGREIVKQLLEKGYALSCLCRNLQSDRVKKVPDYQKIEWVEGDLGDILVLRKAIDEVDFVIHAAALVSFNPGDRNLLNDVNVTGTTNMVNVSLTSPKLKKLIHISSVATMSPSKPMPAEIDERQGFNPDSSTSDYACSKYNAELEVIRGVEEGLKAVLVNPSIILSAGSAEESSSALFNYVQKERPFYPTGWLNYVDVRDIATVVLELMENGPENGERILMSAGHIAYQEFFSKVAAIIVKKPPSIAATKWITGIAWRVDLLVSFFTGTKPLLTRFTAASSSKRLIYKGKALEKFWPDFRYRSLDESLQWILGKNH